MDSGIEQQEGAAPAVQPVLPFSMFGEISSFLHWASERWPALALYGLVMATMLWIDFIRLFDLPVSFISPGMLSALPILGLAVGVPVAGLMVWVACAAGALRLPVAPGGQSLMGWANETRSEDGGEKDQRFDVFNRWMILSVLQSVYWPIWFGLRYFTRAVPAGAVWPVACVISIVVAWFLFRPVFRVISPGRLPGVRYLVVFAFNVAFQTSIATFLVLPVLLGADTSKPFVLVFHAEAYLIILAGIGLSQLLTAKLFAQGWRHDLLKKVFVLVMGVLGFLLLFPDAGGTLAADRLRIQGPGHSTCMRLLFHSPAAAGTSLPVRDKANPDQSVALNFVTRLDDAYYVKVLPQGGATFVVPAVMVAGISACDAAAKANAQ